MANPSVVPSLPPGGESVFDGLSKLAYVQESHWCKCLCPLCFGPDQFKGETPQTTSAHERSEFLNRNIFPCCIPCFQKKMSIDYQTSSNNILTYNQDMNCFLTKGMVAQVQSGGKHIGNVGLPMKLFNTGGGLKNLAIDCASVCGGLTCAGPMGYAAISQQCCLCAGVNILPTRVYNDKDELKYQILASCLQLGVCFSLMPLDMCREITFKIETKEGHEKGTIIHRYDALLMCLRHADKYTINFPQDASREEKALIFGATLNLHYAYFDL